MSALFRLLPETICPAFGNKVDDETQEEVVPPHLKKQASSIKRQNSSMKSRIVDANRANSIQNSIRAAGQNSDRHKAERVPSQKKQQSSSNLAPIDKQLK